ncbi:F-box protein, partial [Endozoicomonas sp. ONNA1]|uniref:F-box protein n=1 Tax=Endozoicomonas sp. ONNA1 TaxID=2828740 RepID=UPI00214742EE
MFSNTNNSGIVDPPSLLPVSTPLEEEPLGVSAGRTIAVPDQQINKTASLHDLPEEVKIKIFRFLRLRDIACLQRVSTHFNWVIKNDHALEKTWFQRFSLPHQYQLKKILPIEDKEQLRNWLRP